MIQFSSLTDAPKYSVPQVINYLVPMYNFSVMKTVN